MSDPSRPEPKNWFRRWHLFAFTLGAAIVLVVSYFVDVRSESVQLVAPPIRDNTSPLPYPRTGTYFIEHEALPTVEELARYDVVVVDSEWQHRVPKSFFDDLRRANPHVRLLAYVNPVYALREIGSRDYWENNYKIWQFGDDKVSRFPDEWLARTADGKLADVWDGRYLTNLTDESPRVNGQLYVEYVADWVIDQIWSTGIWDGIFLDVWGDRIYNTDHDSWDINRDGTDEAPEQIYGPDSAMDRGLTIGEQRMRAAMPTALLVINGVRVLRSAMIDGRVWESFTDPLADREALADLTNYVDVSTGTDHRLPGMMMTIDTRRVEAGSPQDYQRARFELGATLLQDGYWAPMGSDYGQIAYYDEMDGGGLGRGYLGRAREENPDMAVLSRPSADGTGSPAPGVFRRDFDNGIVLVNAGDAPQTITLERNYRRLRGTQDPNTNNGEETTAVTLAPKDGIVLLR